MSPEREERGGPMYYSSLVPPLLHYTTTSYNASYVHGGGRHAKKKDWTPTENETKRNVTTLRRTAPHRTAPHHENAPPPPYPFVTHLRTSFVSSCQVGQVEVEESDSLDFSTEDEVPGLLWLPIGLRDVGTGDPRVTMCLMDYKHYQVGWVGCRP